jgi:hypothetical protein
MNHYSLLTNYITLFLSLFVSLLIYIKYIGKIELKNIPPFEAAAYVVLILLGTIPLLFHTNQSRFLKLILLIFIVITIIRDHTTYPLLNGLGIIYTISLPLDWLYPYLGWLYIPLFSIAVMVYVFVSILIIDNNKNITTLIKFLFLSAFIIEIIILMNIKLTTTGMHRPKEGFIAEIFVLFNIMEALLYEAYIKLRKKDDLIIFLNKKKLILAKIYTTKEEELNSQTIYSYITQHMKENEDATHILNYIQLIDISWKVFITYANKTSRRHNIALSFEIGDRDYHILNQMVLTALMYTVEYLNRQTQNQYTNYGNIELEESEGIISINGFVDCCKNQSFYSSENEVDDYMSRYAHIVGAGLNKYIYNGKAFIHFTIPISGLNKLDRNLIKDNSLSLLN